MKLTPSARALRAINPLAKWASRTPGAKAAIIEVLNRIAPNDNGRAWNRQQVEAWLHPDPTKRHEPKLGAGLALIDAVNQVMDERACEGRKNGSPDCERI